jgi:ferritin-like metal-binding protein YciE
MANVALNTLIVGLRNAHAMERQAQELLERQIERSDEFPEVQSRLRTHLEETHRQLTRVESCLKQLGQEPSTVKDAAMTMIGNLAAMAHMPADDEIIKNTLANNAFEHFEIAAYKTLLTLCERAGDARLSASLQQSLREEEQMAAWIDGHIKQVTLEYLALEERKAA